MKNKCKAFQAGKENLLILMFGYRDEKTHGIQLGTCSRSKPKELQSITKNFSTNVPLLTTQCYGVDWLCSLLINSSTMTAAGPKK